MIMGPRVQHGCEQSAGPGCFLTLRDVVAGEAPGTPPHEDGSGSGGKCLHDGTGFPAEPGTIILRSVPQGESLPLRSFLLIQHAEVHGRLAQHAGVQGALQGGAPHGFSGRSHGS